MAKKAAKKTTRKTTTKTLEKYYSVIDQWFVNGFNGLQAYKTVYPSIKSDNAAAVNFKKLSEKEEVKAYIQKKRDEAARFVDVTHEGMLKELKNILELDITETIGLTSEQMKELPSEFKRCITKYKRNIFRKIGKNGKVTSESEVIEITLISKERAIEAINKHIGFYEKDNQQKAPSIDYDKLSLDTLKELYNAAE